MKKSLKKRGQKFVKKFSKASLRASEDSKEHIKENLIGRISSIANIRLLILEWTLLVVALIMLAVAQTFWFSDSYAENVFVDGGTYIEATLGEVKSLNPLFATTNSEKTLSRLLFATIVANDYSGHPGVGLAKSVTPSEDGKVWTIQLNDGLKWSDNEPLTNEDVLFTIELIKNPAVNTVYDSNLASVKVSENENGEIVFNLPAAYADFMSALIIPVVPKHALQDADPKNLIEDSFSNTPITSGPFSLNASQTGATNTEQVVYLSANPNYYKGKVMLSSFAVHTYMTKDEIIAAINTGAVTATAELSEAEAGQVTSGQFLYKNSSLDSGVFVFFNMSHPSVKDVAIRNAIRQGLDRNAIREAVPEVIGLDYPIMETQIRLENYPAIPEYDAEAAKASVAEAITDETRHLEIATVKIGYLPEVANRIGDELKELGFDVNVTSYDEGQEFISNVISKRNYDLLVYEIEMGADPDPLAYYHSSQKSATGLNLSNYSNALVDDLLLGARDSLDQTLRAKKYETFLEYWVNEVPAIGLYRSNLTYYYNKNVRTFGNDVRLVTALDRFVDIWNWATVKGTKNKTP